MAGAGVTLVTKYEHACIALEENGRILVIDPGVWTTDIPQLSNVDAIVITHNHPDHCNPEHLAALADSNPGVQIFGTQEVADSLAVPHVTIATSGQTVSVGAFHLEFFGEHHAQIHTSIPAIQNIGVLVNDTFYYAGDAFTIPASKAISVLAAPVSAPWLKMAEVIDYYQAIKPRVCIPTHNALLSEIGQGLADRFLQNLADGAQATYSSLKPGQSIEV